MKFQIVRLIRVLVEVRTSCFCCWCSCCCCCCCCCLFLLTYMLFLSAVGLTVLVILQC